MKLKTDVENIIRELVNAGRLAGAATLVWRDGERIFVPVNLG